MQLKIIAFELNNQKESGTAHTMNEYVLKVYYCVRST